jgi:dipeptidyl aminopeptidase/acylaminoacyl peptidase
MQVSRFLRFGPSLACLAFAASWGVAGPAWSEAIPINAWVHDPAISSVGVSPDGNSLAALTITDLSEPPEVTVWDVRNLAAPPKRFRPEDSKAWILQWLNNERLLVVGRQAFDYYGRGRPVKWFRDVVYIVDSEGKKFHNIFEGEEIVDARLVSIMPHRPDKVRVEITSRQFAPDVYEIDLDSLLATRVQRGATGDSLIADYKGDIRGKAEVRGRGDTARIEYSYRGPDGGDWQLHHALYAADREGMQPVGFDPDGRTIYMRDNTGRDKYVISAYDLLEREITDVLFADAAVEATGIVQSMQPEDFGEVVGFTGMAEKSVLVYKDEDWAVLQERIDAALGTETTNRITSISRDFSVSVINATGPKEPGAFYLMVGGQQLVPLGRSRPLLEPEKLAEMRYITFDARDGLEIPAYLTMPSQGSAPYPAVIMPHGGPWARDTLGFDLWAQFLANRGYLVLQPQYRGSEGWGQALWRAGDREWGRKMQDDKDDGARWLVEQGLADPDRLAMYGYSYGGYAAMAAIVRPDTPYQCAIAGAGLSELRTFDKITFEGEWGRVFQNPTVAGLSPLDHAKEAKIPIFVFHGNRDQRVPIEQSEKYVSALRRAGKDVEYLEVVDLWHSYPWFPQHHLAVLSSIEDYLGNRCGPGGL